MEVRVRKGDTLFHFSGLFKIPLELITDANPDVNPLHLQVAQKIQIPGYIAVPYAIQTGETIWKIAKSRKIAIDALLLINQEMDADFILSGETIFVPEKIQFPFFSSTHPLDYKRAAKLIETLKRTYPFINITSIGTSVLGHPIQEIRIGKGAKKLHMNASFHANEWITTMVLLSLVNTYLLSLTTGLTIKGQRVNQFYQDVELSIVPMVNPDGVDLVLNGPPPHMQEELLHINEGSADFIHWKANIRGVDLNNQFPANWEICRENKKPKAPAPRDFPGVAPLTEPEAIAMADLAKNRLFDIVLAFHTQGEEFYWGYEGFEPPEAERLAEEIERVSGYKAVQYVNSHAGYKDWFIQDFKRPGYTLELGKGINPLPLSQFRDILKCSEAIFLAALKY